MKPLTNGEFETLVGALRGLLPARFQDVQQVDSRFFLKLWTPQGGEQVWVLDLTPNRPMLVPAPKSWSPGKSQKSKSPALLFLKAHFLGKTLQGLNWSPSQGRVLYLLFSSNYQAELRLFSGGANLILTAGDKSLSWKKPADLKPLNWNPSDSPGRSMAEIMTEYFYQRQKTAQAGGQDPESLRKSKAEKLQRAIEKVQEDLRSKKDNPWAEAGHWLVAEQSLEAPEHLSACVDPKLGLSENIENCFRKAKELERKQKGSEERLLALQKELALIQNATPEELSVSISSAVRDLQPKPKNFKGRVLRLPSGRTFLMGRSGRENLEVLRQCSPWDYWLHLRDYPGAHGVLRRQKSERITDEELHQAAHILIRESFRTKIESKDGERFDVLLAELRYVRPIKGDRRGLVTYSNERVLQHQFRRL